MVAAVEVSTDGGETWHPASGTSLLDLRLERRRRHLGDDARRGRSTTPATSARRAPAATVAVSCPCSILGSTHAGEGRRRRRRLDLGRDQVPQRRRRHDQRRPLLQVAPPTPAPTSAASGPRTARCWPKRPSAARPQTGWQQVNFASPVQIQPNTTYVASYFAPERPLLRHAWQLNEPPALGASILDRPPLHVLPDVGRRQRRLLLRLEQRLPDQRLPGRQLLGRRPLHAENAAAAARGSPARSRASAGLGQATVSWTAPSQRRRAASYRITPYIGTTAQTPVTVPAHEHLENRSPASPAAPPTPSWSPPSTKPARARLGPLQRGHADRAAPRAPRPASTATAGADLRERQLDRPGQRRRQPDHRLPVTPYVGGQPRARSPPRRARPRRRSKASPPAAPTPSPSPRSTRSAPVRSRRRRTPWCRPPPASRGADRGTPRAKSSGALVTWTAPASDGGSAITGYRVIPYLGATAQAPTSVGGAATSATVNGLTNGTPTPSKSRR